ncbi:MAG: hypothetical protein FNT29_07310 [Halothiobacillaceae bacterium]|nr:MAG: hypothetical protein FNT29_07310 [Halothiobacillaceae bacterium]
MIRIDVLERAILGPWLQLTLRWPGELPAPAPGQCLRSADGTPIWPMRPPQAGRLSVLASSCQAGATLDLSGIEGNALPAPEGETLLLAEGLGLAPLIHLCELARGSGRRLLALYEAADTLPFRPRPSRFMVEGAPHGVIAAIPLLEDWGIPSRLASHTDLPGCHEGGLDALLERLPAPSGAMILAMGSPAFIARLAAIAPRLIPLDIEA